VGHVCDIGKELRRWQHAGHEESVSGTGASNIEQMPFGLVHVVQLDLIGYRLNAGPQGQHVVVARHDDDSLEFQSFRKMHGADGHPLARGFVTLG
jgi:hypothetical protein